MTREIYSSRFRLKIKQKKDQTIVYANPSAHNLSDLHMHQLGDIIVKVGDLRVRTPHNMHELPTTMDDSNDLWWWWKLKRKVIESCAPDTVFGTASDWVIVSQLCYSIACMHFPHHLTRMRQ